MCTMPSIFFTAWLPRVQLQTRLHRIHRSPLGNWYVSCSCFCCFFLSRLTHLLTYSLSHSNTWIDGAMYTDSTLNGVSNTSRRNSLLWTVITFVFNATGNSTTRAVEPVGLGFCFDGNIDVTKLQRNANHKSKKSGMYYVMYVWMFVCVFAYVRSRECGYTYTPQRSRSLCEKSTLTKKLTSQQLPGK